MSHPWHPFVPLQALRVGDLCTHRPASRPPRSYWPPSAHFAIFSPLHARRSRKHGLRGWSSPVAVWGSFQGLCLGPGGLGLETPWTTGCAWKRLPPKGRGDEGGGAERGLLLRSLDLDSGHLQGGLRACRMAPAAGPEPPVHPLTGPRGPQEPRGKGHNPLLTVC